MGPISDLVGLADVLVVDSGFRVPRPDVTRVTGTFHFVRSHGSAYVGCFSIPLHDVCKGFVVQLCFDVVVGY